MGHLLQVGSMTPHFPGEGSRGKEELKDIPKNELLLMVAMLACNFCLKTKLP